jgi:hypothetical protein
VAVSRKKDHENRKVLGEPAHFEGKGVKAVAFSRWLELATLSHQRKSKVIHSRHEKNRK